MLNDNDIYLFNNHLLKQNNYKKYLKITQQYFIINILKNPKMGTLQSKARHYITSLT